MIVIITATLHNVITAYSESSASNGRSAEQAFDGDESTITHTVTDTTVAHWIKATFGKRVFITHVIFVSRLDFLTDSRINRNDNTDLKTILHEDGQLIETVFGNTGDLYDRITFQCNRLADELEAYQSQAVAAQTGGVLNIGEIWVYGHIAF